ncbi:hypothetical protein DB346_00820 [Verrucomicrobia bacterium LW23]|nr:hypothetical protein DB346_00820 [Verrucomicrobia bacterium LW23]
MYIQEKCLYALFVDAKPVEDVFGVSHAISSIVKAGTGTFVLERNLKENFIAEFRFLIPVEQLMLSAMSTMQEVDELRPHFPSEMTVFTTTGHSESWMGDQLHHFYELAGPLLARGASACELAEFTEQPLDTVLLSLYKLRSAGLIAPLRAARPGPSAAPAKMTSPLTLAATASTDGKERPAIFKAKSSATSPLRKSSPRITFDHIEPEHPADAPLSPALPPRPATGSVPSPAAAPLPPTVVERPTPAMPANAIPFPTPVATAASVQKPAMPVLSRSTSPAAALRPAVANLRGVQILRPSPHVMGVLMNRVAANGKR